MHMKVSSRKKKELSKAIISQLNSIRKKRGCVRCDFFHGMEDENLFCLLLEWDSMKDFETYRKSEYYKVLQGAMHLLGEPYEIISWAKCSKNQTNQGYKFTG